MNEWMEFFERISRFYQAGMRQLWGKYPNHATNIWDSLAIFLEGYAFERQGRRPDYFHAAVDSFTESRQQNRVVTQADVKKIWACFRKLLKNQGLNRKNNPLYPSTNPDKEPGIGSKNSVIQVILQENITAPDSSLSTFLSNSIEQDDIRSADRLLRSIRGIGPKVSPFYLRDLVVVMAIDLSNVGNRSLLQPVDVWVERIIKTITHDQLMTKSNVANWIVENSHRPELANMGIWYFGSQIATSHYIVRKALGNLKLAQSLADKYACRLRRAYQDYEDAD